VFAVVIALLVWTGMPWCGGPYVDVVDVAGPGGLKGTSRPHPQKLRDDDRRSPVVAASHGGSTFGLAPGQPDGVLCIRTDAVDGVDP